MACKVGSGKPDPRIIKDTNEELKQIKGEISEKDARLALAKFLRTNPYALLYILTGVKMREFQELAIRAMAVKDFFMMVAGRGVSKSYLAAMYCVYHAICFPGSKIGITAANLRQSKSIIVQIEKWIDSSQGKFLKQCTGKIRHDPDAWSIQLGDSEIVAVPMGANGQRIRGYRFHVLIVDEALLLTEEIFDTVIIPFLSATYDSEVRQELVNAEDTLVKEGVIKDDERTYLMNNKLIVLSSASYKFEYLYKIYTDWMKAIFPDEYEPQQEEGHIQTSEKGKRSRHGIMQFSYEAFKHTQWLQIEGIEERRKNSSQAHFDREYRARFTDESGGFYSLEKLLQASIRDGGQPSLKIKGNPDKNYILTIDPNYNNADTSDFFAMVLLELDEPNETAYVVHNYALSKSQTGKRERYMKYLWDNFNIKMVVADNAGGPKFMNDCMALNMIPSLGEFEPPEELDSYEELQKARFSYKPDANKILYYQQFNRQDWIRRANENLQWMIERKHLMFGGRFNDSSLDENMNYSIGIEDLEFNDDTQNSKVNHKMKQANLIIWQNDLMNEARQEIALIELTRSGNSYVFDLPIHLKKDKSVRRARRDLYTAILMGAWATKIYFNLHKQGIKPKIQFMPQFIA